MKIRVLVVDDSPFIRRIISDWIKSDSRLLLVGVAGNGKDAVKMAQDLKPDVITLDVEMPVMDGLTALEEIMKSNPLPVLMVSSLTTKGANTTFRALELGAIDFIAKPGGSKSLDFMQVKEELLEKIIASKEAKLSTKVSLSSNKKESIIGGKPISRTSDKVIVIACSTGGPKALTTLFESLPPNFSAPILIVQHMPAGFIDNFAKRLSKVGPIKCKVAEKGDKFMPGMALMAPGDKHMVVNGDKLIDFDDSPKLHGVKPSADILFYSVAKNLGKKAVGVVLTGMGVDGADGALEMFKQGSIILTESRDTCTIYGMPRATVEKQASSKIVRIENMVSELIKEL